MNPHTFLRTIIAMAAAVLAFSFASTAEAEEHTIHAVAYRDYESMFFEPDYLRVEPGDTVRFEVDDRDHQPRSVFIPPGAAPWRAEPGTSISVELTEEGVYLFDCVYHNVMGMAGVIVVGMPVNAAEAAAFFGPYREETFAMNKDRLDHIFDPEEGLLATGGRP